MESKARITPYWYLKEVTSNRALIRDDSEKWPDDVDGQPHSDWVKFYLADELHKSIGMGITRYTEVMTELESSRAHVSQLQERIEGLVNGIETALSLHEPIKGADLSEYGEGARDAWKMIMNHFKETLAKHREPKMKDGR